MTLGLMMGNGAPREHWRCPISLTMASRSSRPGIGQHSCVARIKEIDTCRVLPSSMIGTGASVRSEEHTSELQSLMRISYDVFCLKNKNYIIDKHTAYLSTY